MSLRRMAGRLKAVSYTHLKAFGKVAFNLSINAAARGGALLQQAWFDVQLKKQFAIRVGKFKTPFSVSYTHLDVYKRQVMN